MTVKGDLVNNWEFFKQQWTDYEVATGLGKQEQKIRFATFRSAMGKECLQIFLNLKLTTEEQQDIDECKALEAYFKPKRNVVYERYLFNMCQQNSGETVDSYVNLLPKAASTCQFGTLTEELIRDRLVIGLQDQATKRRLLKEENLDMNKALNICRSSEIATQQLKAMKTEENKTEDVRAIQAVRATKESHANPLMARKHAMHHQTKGNIEKRVLNTRAINATAVEENRGIHWKTVQHLGTNVKRARSLTISHRYANHHKNVRSNN